MLRRLLPVFLLGLGTQAGAQDYSWLDNPKLIILRAAIVPQSRLLYVEGENFGSRRLPSVTLDEEPLTVRSATDNHIEAGPLPPSIGPGSRVLRVVAGDDRSRFDAFSVELRGQPSAPPAPRHDVPTGGYNRLGILDDAGDVGWSPSIAIGADGLPVVAYLDYTNLDLEVAHCSDPACDRVNHALVDADGDIGWSIDLAIGGNGLPIIAYFDSAKGTLKVARCQDAGCDSARVFRVDTAGSVGSNPAVALGADGLPVIAYHDHSNSDLKVTHCQNPACSSADVSTLYSAGSVGWHISIVAGADGLLLIASYDETNGICKLARCRDLACSRREPPPSRF